MNTPSNPTGAVFTRSEIEKIGKAIEKAVKTVPGTASAYAERTAGGGRVLPGNVTLSNVPGPAGARNLLLENCRNLAIGANVFDHILGHHADGLRCFMNRRVGARRAG